MIERMIQEKAWKRLFDQWIFDLFGTFVVLMSPISLSKLSENTPTSKR